MGIERTRVIEVYAAASSGGRVGSGYLLDNRLVLTARHVVEPSTSVEVRPLGLSKWVGASVVWSDEAADAALLRVDGGASAPKGVSPRWGLIGGREAVAVSAVGFPWAHARSGSPRDSEQLFGHVAPLTGVKGGRSAISVATSVPRRPGGVSGWAGMSGAALFAGPYLVGIITTDAGRFGPDRIVATPAAVLLSDQEFAHLVAAQVPPTVVGSRFRLEVATGLSVALVAPYRDLPPAFDPAAVPVVLLAPDHGLVPFLGREAELAELARWCDTDGLLGIRLVIGAGGTGKTRLVAEACVAATTRGWVAGLADARVPGGETALELEDRTLLVVDEADTKVDLLAGLLTHLLSTPTPARVLLVARRLGLWFDQLAQEVPYLKGLPGIVDPVVLNDVVLDEEERDRHFAAAAAAFAPRLGATIPTVSPWSLADPTFGSPLLVHMSALVAAKLGAPGEGRGEARDARGEVLDALVDSERRRWRRSVTVAGLTDLDPSLGDRAIAVATLAGADDEGEALSLLEALPELADRRAKVARWLHELYPGDAWLNPIQPDVLAARHLVRTLPTVSDLLTRLYDRAGNRRSAMLATLLRAGADEPTLEVAVRRFLEERLASLVEAATADTRLSPLVARLCQFAPVPESAHTAVDTLPTRSISLATLAAVLYEQATAHYRALAAGKVPDVYLAFSLKNLSAHLAGLGRADAALVAAEESVAHFREAAELVAHFPEEADVYTDGFMPHLASSLTNLSTCLSSLGRREEAFEAAEEAVSIRLAVVEVHTDDFRGELATSLTVLSKTLIDLGRPNEALEPAMEAVTHHRALAAANPGSAPEELALSLYHLGGSLFSLGRWEEAFEAAQEALAYTQQLVDADPDAHLDTLAATLSALSTTHFALGRFEQAEASAKAAVSHYRALAEANPGAFLGNLAHALGYLSNILFELGVKDDAVEPVEEALALREEEVAHYRALAEANPGGFAYLLATSVYNLSVMLAKVGRQQDALECIEEAVAHYRVLADASPHFQNQLHNALNKLSNLLAGLGREREAHAARQESALFERIP